LPIENFLDFIFPPLPRCVVCGHPLPVQDHRSICDICLGYLRRPLVARDCCRLCGRPLARAERDFCRECSKREESFGRVHPGALYRDPVATLVKRMKYGAEPHLAAPLTCLIAEAVGPWLKEYDCLVPVPISRRKMAERRYNQSLLLARRLLQMGGPPVVSALTTVKDHDAQATLSRTERQENLSGSISVPACRRSTLARKSVLLIDDVFTTGATAHACACQLLSAGAARVDVAVIAIAVMIST
jgi:ComF family protein